MDYLNANRISCNGLYLRGDSEIVLKQLEGTYKVRSRNIIGNYIAVVNRLNQIDKQFVKYTHVERSRNAVADGLANQAIADLAEYVSG